MCSYGARQVGKGLYAFNRRLDHLRSTMAALVDKHSRPPPLKKMCLSRDSSQDSTSLMDVSPPSHAPNLQMNNSAALSAISSSAFTFSAASPFESGGGKNLTAPRSNGSGVISSAASAHSLNRTKSLPGAVCNNLSKGLGSGKKLGKACGKSLSKSADGKPSASASFQHPIKNSKARRKSGGGGKVQSGLVAGGGGSSVPSSLFSASTTTTPVTLTAGTGSYSIVANSSLQAGELLGSGMVNLDPASLANQELSSSLLKNLRFVVTNIDPGVNGGAGGAANAAQPQTSANFTVPIINATLGNAPLLLGNLGALALPCDGKLGVKSRTKGAGKSPGERPARRLSGGNAVAGLQNVAIVSSQPLVDSLSHEAVASAGIAAMDRVTATNTSQPLQSPQSVPSPQLRPNSASPQLTSPLPNGIIPSPTSITFKPHPSTSVATTTVAANHVQRGLSPSRQSTPSPGAGVVAGGATSLAEAAPNLSGQLLAGAFNTAGKITLVSPKGTSHTLSKPALNQKHGHHQPLPHRTVSQLSNQQQQQQALQFHQLQLTPQQLQQQLSNLVAMDAQGKPLPLGNALLPGLFQGIPTQQVGAGSLPAGLTLAPVATAEPSGHSAVSVASATANAGKVLSQSAVLPQGAITLLQSPGGGQPIRLQGASLADQSQLGMGQDEDNRQELKMQH